MLATPFLKAILDGAPESPAALFDGDNDSVSEGRMINCERDEGNGRFCETVLCGPPVGIKIGNMLNVPSSIELVADAEVREAVALPLDDTDLTTLELELPTEGTVKVGMLETGAQVPE